jgi:HAD superfamily hydrolase (TIGR01509 family)
MSWRIPRLVAVLLLAVVALAGCRAEASVTVLVEDEHGAGTVLVDVLLDREAVDRMGGIEQLRVADLEAAGWRVAEQVTTDDGAVSVRASKGFADPAAMVAVLDEVSGPAGPYSRLGLVVEREFARTNFRLEGVLDGSVGVDAFADAGLAEALDGLPFGIDLAELEAELGSPIGSSVVLRLQAALPGDRKGSDQAAVTTVLDDDGRSHGVLVWETDLNAESPVPVLVASEVTRTRTIALAIAAAAFAVLFVLLVIVGSVVGLRRRRRRRRAERLAAATPRPIDRRDRDRWTDDYLEDRPLSAAATGSEGADHDEVAAPAGAAEGAVVRTGPRADPSAGGPTPAAPPASPPPLELVVIGGPGVAFGMRDPVDDLVAFARAHGSVLEYPKIAEHYAAAEVGRLSSAELWVAIGAEGDPTALDEELLGQYQLAPGMRDFVMRARDRGYRVAYLGDGPAAWADILRRSFVLTDLVDPWVVSANVGARLPEPAMFEALRRISSVEPASCLLIDDRLRVLEAASAYGFGTAWYSPTGRAKEAPGHSIIRGFVDLLKA